MRIRFIVHVSTALVHTIHRLPFLTSIISVEITYLASYLSLGNMEAIKAPGKPLALIRSSLVASVAVINHCPRILSLDGGGVRGLSSLLILREVMEEIGRRAETREPPLPCQYFDLIGSTGTGGLIAIMLGRLRMVHSSSIPERFNFDSRSTSASTNI